MDRENRQHSSGYRRPAAPYEQRESAWGQNPANGQGSTWSQQTYGNQSAGQGPVEAVRPNPTAKFRPYGESARQEGPSTNQTGEQARPGYGMPNRNDEQSETRNSPRHYRGTDRPLYAFDSNYSAAADSDEPGYYQNGGEPPEPPKHPHAWRRRIVLIGAGVLLLWLLLFILPIPFGSITVTGSQNVTVSDVMAAGNIRYPVNLLQINASQLEERLQHDLRVDSVKVTYVLPLTLQVNVTERRAAAVVATQFGFATLDAKGQVINVGAAIEDTSALIISGIKLGNVLLGDQIDEPVIKGALTYLNSLSDEGRKQIAEINVGDANQLIAYTVDGLPLHLGDTTDMDKKGPLSENMLRDVKARGVAAQYLDVNVKAPFIKTP